MSNTTMPATGRCAIASWSYCQASSTLYSPPRCPTQPSYPTMACSRCDCEAWPGQAPILVRVEDHRGARLERVGVDVAPGRAQLADDRVEARGHAVLDRRRL